MDDDQIVAQLRERVGTATDAATAKLWAEALRAFNVAVAVAKEQERKAA